MLVVGYMPGDFPIAAKAVCNDMIMTVEKNYDVEDRIRSISAVLHPYVHVLDVGGTPMVNFAPDRKDVASKASSLLYRIGVAMPERKESRISKFVKFAKVFIMLNFESLTSGEMVDTSTWLRKSSYGGSRVADLKRKGNLNIIVDGKTLQVKTFVKDEAYATPKHPRAIMSFSDESKVLIGAIARCIDKKTFANERFFVKGTDPKKWPEMLKNMFGERPVMETDFTSMEAHHTGEFLEIVHFWFMHMIRDCGVSNDLKRLLSQMIKGRRDIRMKGLRASVDERLMSGAMWTSSSNAILNLCLMAYLTSESQGLDPEAQAKWATENFVGKIEGDDGITAFSAVDTKVIEELGLKLKFEVHDRYGDASFCGIVCHPDSDRIITDPIKVLKNFFMLPIKYQGSPTAQRRLLRAKALSYMYNFKHCPVVGPMVDAICRITTDVRRIGNISTELGFKSEYAVKAQEAKLWDAVVDVSSTDRVHMSNKFGMSISDQQVYEAAFNSWDGLKPLVLPYELRGAEYYYAENFVVPDLALAPPVPLVPEYVLDDMWACNPFIRRGIKSDAFQPFCNREFLPVDGTTDGQFLAADGNSSG